MEKDSNSRRSKGEKINSPGFLTIPKKDVIIDQLGSNPDFTSWKKKERGGSCHQASETHA